MVKFLDSSQVSGRLTRIIKEANKELVLVSPYMELDTRIKRVLKNRSEAGINIIIIFRPAKSNKDAIEWLKKLPKRKIYSRTYLHSKCYLNEKQALITSMNLTKKSNFQNYEMGILLNKENHSDVYSSIKREISHLIEVSDEKYKRKKESLDTSKNTHKLPGNGYCIRCKKKIDLDPTSPYCGNCYKTWKKYKDPEYKEKYCHICGKKHKTMINKPVCRKCYNSYKNKLEFKN